MATAAHCVPNVTAFVCPPFPDDVTIPPGSIRLHPQGRTKVDAALIDLPADSVYGSPIPTKPGSVGSGEQVALLGFAAVPGHFPGLGVYPGYVESVLDSYPAGIRVIQVTNEVSGGMSGGPVIDRNGYLVGIALGKSYEKAKRGVPRRPFRHVLPVEYLVEIRD